ncbi:MAG: hypothetical protein ACTTHM_02145 [Peptoanaerobacter stomatis]|uniref:hypothetical protein n=1 Tax=Peptoanaerobacter stomatis TaxID=796937 RepID=UPI003FA0EB3C
MKNSKYSIFSKEELIDFLDNYESRFKSIFSVYRILIQKRIDKKNKEIQENLNEDAKILEISENTDDICEKLKQMQKYRDNHNRWLKLCKELDVLYEKMKKYM